jgi:hypothetical protein
MESQVAQEKTATDDPRARFVRAANTRVNRAVDDIRIVGKLSSDRYEYGPDDVRRIIDALLGAVENARLQLENRPTGKADVRIIPD